MIAQRIREGAMLLYSPAELAAELGMSEAALRKAMDEEPELREAWRQGRLRVKRSLYAALLKNAREEGTVAAIRLAIELADREIDEDEAPATSAPRNARRDDEAEVRALFLRNMERERGRAG